MILDILMYSLMGILLIVAGFFVYFWSVGCFNWYFALFKIISKIIRNKQIKNKIIVIIKNLGQMIVFNEPTNGDEIINDLIKKVKTNLKRMFIALGVLLVSMLIVAGVGLLLVN